MHTYTQIMVNIKGGDIAVGKGTFALRFGSTGREIGKLGESLLC